MPERRDRSRLPGRRQACETLERLVADARAGESRVLVLRGEAGIGKTALLEHMLEHAQGCRIARAPGVESEMELPLAGLHQLCAPMLGELGRLPGPQRDALKVAFGLQDGPAPERFLVALAALSLLAEVAEDAPLVCVLDDAQWLDQASTQTLTFVGRRLLAERIAMVFAVRTSEEESALADLPELAVGPLADADARQLLASGIPGRLDDRVRDRLIAEAHGNPLALLELPRGSTAAELAGGFGLLDTGPVRNRIEQSFVRRMQSLPRDSQRLLLTAAAEPVGDAALIWRAGRRLGIDGDAAGPAEDSGLIELGARARFRHPLVRAAVYRAADPLDRQEVHQALAAETDPEADPDRRAWHRAQAATGLDEAVAAELERSAGRAQRRGGAAAAAAFLARATELTPDAVRRGARALAAGQAKFDAGAPEAALELLELAEQCPLGAVERARLERLRGQVAFVRRRGRDAPPLLLEAARQLEPLDAALARETYLEALGAAVFAGRLVGDAAMHEIAAAARAAPGGPDPPRAVDLLLDGLAIRFTDGYAASVAPLRRALAVYAREQDRRGADLRWLWLAWPLANEVWDDVTWTRMTTRAVELARDAGALAGLPIALLYRAGVHMYSGEFASAAALVEEAQTLTVAAGNDPLGYASPAVAAYRGEEAAAMRFIDATTGGAAARGEGRAIAAADYARALLYNGLGRYEEAFEAARRAGEHEDLGLANWALTELVEAAVRVGDRDVANAALRRLEERAQAGGTEWALGIAAQSRALVSEGDTADAHYREAIERLGNSSMVVQHARAQLLYGEWLRREHRREDAREQLRTAYDTLGRIGAEAFAERARRELLATGATARRRNVETVDALTAQEAQVARMARDGHTNPEIGAQLFISPRTVEYHLRKVFPKLGISSRKELRTALPGDGGR